MKLFDCPFSCISTGEQHPELRLDSFIAHALQRTNASESVTFLTLWLLRRLSTLQKDERAGSGHRLFISAFILAHKFMCDESFLNLSWCVVAQDLFELREINQMERELFHYLDMQINVDKETLVQFRDEVVDSFWITIREQESRCPTEHHSILAPAIVTPSGCLHTLSAPGA